MLYYNRKTNETCSVLAIVKNSFQTEFLVKFHKTGEELEIEQKLFETLYAPSTWH